ncbi:hypothetical protein [Geodermatophilus sp. CPCC 206100]|uniref:hypothetical protein n=1 Tax=Geodermatophilus sp. CPCC 206100 TaxID=3020054 RepID=UPI003AFFAACC
MTSTMWTTAPTGVTGAGTVVVRPGALLAGRPFATRLRALGTPVCGAERLADLVPTRRGTDLVRTPDAFGAVFGPMNDQQDTSTTLGIHSPGRPRS